MADSTRVTAGADATTESTAAHATITRSFLQLGSGEAVARLVAFACTMLLARRLGTEGLGVVSFSMAILLYLSRIVDAGFDLGIGVREAASRRDSLRDFVPAILGFRLALAAVVVAITAVVALTLLPATEGRVVSLYALTLIPLGFSARWVLTGLDRTAVAGVSRTIGEVVVLLTVVAVVHGGTDIWRVPLAQVAGDTVAAVAVLVALRRLGVGVRAPRLQPEVVRPLLPNVVPYVGSTLLGIVVFNADILFLRAFRDASTVGLYAAAYALVSFLINIGGIYGLTLLPSLTRLAADGAARQAVYENAALRALVGALPVAVGGAMIAPGIMDLVYGDDFAAAAVILSVLLVSVPVSIVRSVTTSAVMSERREDLLLRTVAWTAVTYVLLNFVFVPRYGMMGAALVTVATEVFRLGVALRYASRVGYAAPAVGRTLRPLLAVAVMAAVLLTPVRASPWLAVPVAAVTYAAALALLGVLRVRRGQGIQLVA